MSAHAVNGPSANAAAPRIRQPGAHASTANPIDTATAQGAISGRSEAAHPPKIAAANGLRCATAASVARSVASDVSIPLTAWAERGTESATAARMASLTHDAHFEVAPMAWPRTAPAMTHATSPTALALPRTASGGPCAKGKRRSGQGNGVTPSVGGARTSKRQPSPPATCRA